MLAPMATVSHEAFRRAVARFGGCDEYVTEMIHAPSLLAGGQWEPYYLMSGPEPDKIVWQLTGNKADSLARAAALLAGREGLGIDLNMGCCALQIARTGAGIAWMLKPLAETAAMVRGVQTAIANAAKDGAREKRLSVKLRLGAEDFTDDGFFAFCDMLVGEGVQLLTLHPRTQKEKYRRPPRWDYVERLAVRYGGSVPVILNGNVCDRASYALARAAAPHASGVMIARAAAQKPWIFAELRGAHPNVNLEQVALAFIDDVEECQPPEFHKTRLQRFFSYFCDNVTFAHWFKTQMLNAATPDQSRKRVRAYFAQCPQDMQAEAY
ncbi:MAG: tRNA-dihydrouridine synthase family protein [Treponemataceae bacterium]|nr:tRNA-dihydrouridine synthase family protein [Treponemataceae bacterium]